MTGPRSKQSTPQSLSQTLTGVQPVAPMRRPLLHRLASHPEFWLALVSLFWLASSNRFFLVSSFEASSAGDGSSIRLIAGLIIALFALNWLLLLTTVLHRPGRWLLALWMMVGAVLAHFIGRYGVFIDPEMLRNSLKTDLAEAGELLTPSLVLDLTLFGLVPATAVWRLWPAPRTWRQASLIRLSCLLVAILTLLSALLWISQPFSSLMRMHRELRYLITPSNLIWSGSQAIAGQARERGQPLKAVGLDVTPGPLAQQRQRPLRIVVVVGETVRAQNWGLNGYARNTTPQLAQRAPINFNHVRSCGTNTEVSVPCMFAPVGRRQYDEAVIRGHESLLHVFARAGWDVSWHDNQSGCKGVCQGLSYVQAGDKLGRGLCEKGRCPDEVLLDGIPGFMESDQAQSLRVLHMLGNHGPSYWRRYPTAFEQFKPACRKDDLSACSRDEIVNAYDNAVLYTDHLLARLIDELTRHEDRVDSVLIYVSDHGESLGERGLYLHGMPWAIAPEEQTRVPMVFWFSKFADTGTGVALDCLRAQASTRQISHDHLFHTLMGLADLRSLVHEPAFDLAGLCSRPPQQDASHDAGRQR
jgi:lipid A ethanolaminephosphotransferase